MARYEVRLRRSVTRDLRSIPTADVQRILARIEFLRDDPRPVGAEKLSAQERYRVRPGDYRILYTVADVEVVIEIVKVGHRCDVYREP
jgi:mRNA interferase RelE/StbE